MIRYFVFIIALLCFKSSFTQNIGINKNNPQASLDITGDIITSTGIINLTGISPVGDINAVLDVNTTKHSSYKLTAGPSTFGSLTVVGLSASFDGRIVHLINATNYSNITIFNNETNDPLAFNPAQPNERISTSLVPGAVGVPTPPGTGNMILKPKGTLMLQYDGNIQKWVVRGSHMSNLSYLGDENWFKTANDITNTNIGNVGIGVSNPTAKLDVDGGNNSNPVIRGKSSNTSTNAISIYGELSGNAPDDNSSGILGKISCPVFLE